MLKQVPVIFGFKMVVFFIALEGITVPLVALANKFATSSWQAMAIMGFLVAFLGILLLLKVLNKIILRIAPELFNLELSAISGLFYIGVLAGILETIMFLVQDYLFARGFSVYLVGFISAFISVAMSLLIYQSFARWCNWGIRLISDKAIYFLHFQLIDIAKLALLFGIYELIVCPITGWWVPFYGWMRIVVALASGVFGGAIGALILCIINKLIPCSIVKLSFKVKILENVC